MYHLETPQSWSAQVWKFLTKVVHPITMKKKETLFIASAILILQTWMEMLSKA